MLKHDAKTQAKLEELAKLRREIAEERRKLKEMREELEAEAGLPWERAGFCHRRDNDGKKAMR